ncbi:hypothetical protein MKW98_026355 [Papaver atlanticum]|uniref:DEAD/DEAH-box helicase domain-containing protein n=1 Tax=Papaver atlanticum TaxID=357466 RepID=A0AAD4SQV7_9MAGN|nr:hypothetical protein MKW98_026355 [Papaver atlanticum]
MATIDGSMNGNCTAFKRMSCGLPDSEAYFDGKNEHDSWNRNKVIKLNPCETSRNDICSKSSMGIELVQANHNGQMKVKENAQSFNSQAMKYHLKMDRPSKFMIMCLTRIEDALLRNGTLKKKKHKSFLVSDWGIEFWQGFVSGSNILDTSGDCSSIEQIAWIVSTAADVISENEKEGLDIDGPSFLYLVPSQERAAQVRSVCKPLQELGIQTVCLHTAAPLDHQIRSLKASEPEFVISTPERFLELVSLEAIDVSGLSLLVIDRLECCIRDGLLNEIKATKQSIPGESQAVIFNGSLGSFSSSALQNLMGDHKAICRLSANISIASQSAGISQSVDTCTSEEKLSKGIQILNKEYGMRSQSKSLKALFVGKDVKSQLFADTLTAQGYSILKNPFSDGTQDLNSEKKAIVCLADLDEVGRMTNMGEFEVVIMISLPPSISNYVSILIRMARRTVNGVLHSLFSLQEDANLVGPLTEILEQCGQTIPVPLRNYLYSSSLL